MPIRNIQDRDKLIRGESESASKFLIFAAKIIAIALLLIVGWSIVSNAQTIPNDTTYRYYKTYKIHVYYPKVYKAKYPIVDLAFGGGFRLGSWRQLTDWKDTFVNHGYAVALIEYETSLFAPMRDAAEKGIQCGQCVVRFEKKFRDKLRIDTSKIYYTGKSAGSVIATCVPYMINSDCNSANVISLYSDYSNSVKAVCNFSGAIFDLTWLQRNKTPVLNIWGDLDSTVKPQCAKDFGIIACGGESIYNQMIALGHKTEAYNCDLCKHCLLPKDSEYQWRINHSLELMINFFQ